MRIYDQFFTFLNIGRHAFLQYIVTHQRATLQQPKQIWHFIWYMLTQYWTTIQRPWRSLLSLSALGFIGLLMVTLLLWRSYSLAFPRHAPRCLNPNILRKIPKHRNAQNPDSVGGLQTLRNCVGYFAKWRTHTRFHRRLRFM